MFKGFGLVANTLKGRPAGAKFKPVLSAIWDAAGGEWQKRAAEWKALGIRSEEGRGGFGNYYENVGADDPDYYGKYNYACILYQRGEITEEECRFLFPTAKTFDAVPTPSKIVPFVVALELERVANSSRKMQRPTMSSTTVCATDWMKRGTDAGGSVFNPALCEALYEIYTRTGWVVRDPFAGGSVRGVVAAGCGRVYEGMELRPEQVLANREQAQEICGAECPPHWEIGDSRGIDAKYCTPCDFVFSCPPYGDLEVYSHLAEDISRLNWLEFVAAYHTIIAETCKRLNDNRFAAFVVGNFRDPKTGFFNDLVGETIKAFRACGLAWVGDISLITPRGSLPIRVTKQFRTTRKVGKTHQNILIFCKGDPAAAWREVAV